LQSVTSRRPEDFARSSAAIAMMEACHAGKETDEGWNTGNPRVAGPSAN
jgi:hypothetical protein